MEEENEEYQSAIHEKISDEDKARIDAELEDMYQDCKRRKREGKDIIVLHMSPGEKVYRYILLGIGNEEDVRRILPHCKCQVGEYSDDVGMLWYMIDTETFSFLLFRQSDKPPYCDDIHPNDVKAMRYISAIKGRL